MSAANVLLEVAAERARQDATWGQQDHIGVDAFVEYGVPSAASARAACATASAGGTVSWAHILVEEVAEALEAPSTADLRQELVQIAAVAVAWIESIDRTRHGGPSSSGLALEEFASWGPVMAREASTWARR